MMSAFAIDGRAFEMGRVDAVSRRGEVERWEVVNASFMDHPFHVHGTQFQVVSRTSGGRATPEPRLAWKDTVNVLPGETVAFLVRQDEAGLRMYHCHILEHEDAGMMGVLSVT
jgi:bilirubin oxidase